MSLEARDKSIALEIIKRSNENTRKVCKELAEIYNLSRSRIYAIAKREGAIKKKQEMNGVYKRKRVETQEEKNMIPFTENFGIKVGIRYNITVKNPQGTDIRHERVKCTYRRKDNWYFCFENITVNRGNIITGEVKVKAV